MGNVREERNKRLIFCYFRNQITWDICSEQCLEAEEEIIMINSSHSLPMKFLDLRL